MGLRHERAADSWTQPRRGCCRFADVTQGSASDGATLGWRTEARWDSRAWPCEERRREMIDGLKPYPEYKESGSPWLGAIPAHWSLRNFRTFISRRDERNRPDLPLLSVARERGVFVRSLTDDEENHNVIPEDLSNYKVARAGNLVINKMKAWQGSMGIAPCDGIVSPGYFVFDFTIGNHAFGQALLRSKPYVAHFGQASDGVRIGQWDLTIAGMRQIPVLVPPRDEQDAIVR